MGAPVHTEDIEYHFDRLRLVGELSVEDSTSGVRPAVLVCHEGNGLTDHSKDVAHRLAELGFVAFALDYYGEGKPLAPEEMGARFQELNDDPLRTRAIAGAGLEQLLNSPYADRSRVASIGFCFGGTMSLELGRAGTDLRAIVGFHAGLATTRPEDAVNLTGRVLVCIGSDDPFVPPEQRAAFEAEMRSGGVDWRMNLYGGQVHSFTNPAVDAMGNPALRYDSTTAARSWRAMLDLFSEVF
jgi:dienelactone hydrolase